MAELSGARQAGRQTAEKIAVPGGVRASPEHRELLELASDDLLAQLKFFGRHGQAQRGEALKIVPNTALSSRLASAKPMQ
ncbi:hypothetical protein [Rhizobium laguerreae]|uniref:hypothetical protein n=1 Tax=Rhizobium laguerreae TaxID=1076926 RepID=UPI0035E41290